MVEPTWDWACRRSLSSPQIPAGRGDVERRPGRRTCPLWLALGVALMGLGPAGCGIVPKSRLDDCHRLSQTLQTENNRLKDVTISLRSQNQDLNQRAVDDARRLRLQDEEIQRLVQSVSAYQEERDQLAAAFERVKSQIRTTVSQRDPASGSEPVRTATATRSDP